MQYRAVNGTADIGILVRRFFRALSKIAIPRNVTVIKKGVYSATANQREVSLSFDLFKRVWKLLKLCRMNLHMSIKYNGIKYGLNTFKYPLNLKKSHNILRGTEFYPL